MNLETTSSTFEWENHWLSMASASLTRAGYISYSDVEDETWLMSLPLRLLHGVDGNVANFGAVFVQNLYRSFARAWWCR